MNSPSPQSVKPANLLNHLPSGTTGSESSQRARRIICSAEMFRSRMRANRWVNNGFGSLRRRILGMRVAAVESADNFFLQSIGLGGVPGFDHSVGQFA